MNCNETQDKLTDYVYGELSPEEAEDAEQHLRDCPKCSAQAATLRSTRAALELACESDDHLDEPPKTIELVQRAAARTERARRRWRRASLLGLAVSLMLAAFLAILPSIEVHGTHLVIRWSERDVTSLPDPQPPPSPSAETQLNESLADHERRLDAVDRLLDLVVGEIEADDRQLQRVVSVLSEWLTAIERRDSDRWKAVRRKILELDLGQTSIKNVSFQSSTSGD